MQPLDQVFELKLLGSDAPERRERAVKHMVEAIELACDFDTDDGIRLLDHADHLAVAIWIAAILTLRRIADVVTHHAEPELVLDVKKGLGEPIGVLATSTQDGKGHALRGF